MERRVLILDDDVDTLELITILLDQTMKVSTAINVAEALLKLKTNYFDLVICDINIGSDNGFQFIEELQSNLLEIPVIFISGDVDSHHEVKAMQLGALAIIEKPFNLEILIETVRKGLDPIRRVRDSKARRLARAA